MSDPHPPAMTVEAAQKRIMEQPFTVLLGARIVAIGEDCCALEVPAREELRQQHGFLHGGVVGYAADNALTIAGFLALRVPVVTSEFKINYLRPAIGEAIVARAHVVHAGRSQAVSRCDVFAVADGQEKLCAVAQGTIAPLAAPAAG